MEPLKGELRSHLDPMALRILKKRLASGKITPQVFKDILKQQMVKYFFRTYRHPLLKPWQNWRQSAKNTSNRKRSTRYRSTPDTGNTLHHKRF